MEFLPVAIALLLGIHEVVVKRLQGGSHRLAFVRLFCSHYTKLVLIVATAFTAYFGITQQRTRAIVEQHRRIDDSLTFQAIKSQMERNLALSDSNRMSLVEQLLLARRLDSIQNFSNELLKESYDRAILDNKTLSNALDSTRIQLGVAESSLRFDIATSRRIDYPLAVLVIRPRTREALSLRSLFCLPEVSVTRNWGQVSLELDNDYWYLSVSVNPPTYFCNSHRYKVEYNDFACEGYLPFEDGSSLQIVGEKASSISGADLCSGFQIGHEIGWIRMYQLELAQVSDVIKYWYDEIGSLELYFRLNETGTEWISASLKLQESVTDDTSACLALVVDSDFKLVRPVFPVGPESYWWPEYLLRQARLDTLRYFCDASDRHRD